MKIKADSLKIYIFTLANIKQETDVEWCGDPSDFQEETYSEEEYRMVETSNHPSSKSQAAAMFNTQHFLGNMFLGDGFKPVYKQTRASPTTSSSNGSLFTIDSILAPRPKPSSPQRPIMHHSSLHLGHIAAAASGFGATSADFLGK